jgi:hypothetical protein
MIAPDDTIVFKLRNPVPHSARRDTDCFSNLFRGGIPCISLEMIQDALIHVVESSAHTQALGDGRK